jgi:hypothetical protein
MDVETLEGTWEEIAEHSEELAGRRVQVRILPDPASDEGSRDTQQESFESWQAGFRAWLASLPKDVPVLSDEAMSRESIYEGRGL